MVTMPKKSVTFQWQFVQHSETLQKAAVTQGLAPLAAGTFEL